MALRSPLREIPGLAGDLERVESALGEAVRADDDFLTEVASHLIRAGGKRQRPAFALAAAAAHGAVPPATDEAIEGGVAVELVHLGSLYHDDVMDDAATRRTVESVNARWGNLKAILAGDFLLARASEIAAGLGTEVAGLLAATISRLCEGQVRELKDVYNVDRSIPDYVASIRGKTASLFATACRIGGLVGDLPREDVDLLTDFGLQYGMAFQVVDDLLDLVATDAQLGKPAGNDLVEGVYTLPVLHTLAHHEQGGELRSLLGSPLTPEQRDRARDLVREAGAIEWSLDHARQHTDAARTALERLQPTPAVSGLLAQTDWLIGSVVLEPAD